MGRTYVRWAITHADYYQVMFGSELDKSDNPELLAAGARTFGDLLDAIVRCQRAKLLPAGNPRDVAGPIWALLHGVATLAIGGDLKHVDIKESPLTLIERALEAMLFSE